MEVSTCGTADVRSSDLHLEQAETGLETRSSGVSAALGPARCISLLGPWRLQEQRILNAEGTSTGFSFSLRMTRPKSVLSQDNV